MASDRPSHSKSDMIPSRSTRKRSFRGVLSQTALQLGLDLWRDDSAYLPDAHNFGIYDFDWDVGKSYLMIVIQVMLCVKRSCS